ncbi:hypothetical protein [Agromyces sp. NPDC058126]|uniref:hypothetical protein n=1 Tax=Agromyces sp. NPDC058126 TaxID=3346350 RepID=UPI0036D91A0A
MRDFWDSIAQFFGYDQWLWGSAADWVGAVGTAGAFLFGFLILQRDKSKDERLQADAFATWYEFRERPAVGSLSPTYDAIVHAHNGGSVPVPSAWITEATTGRTPAVADRRVLGHKTGTGVSIGPAQSTSVVLSGFERKDIGDRYVEFFDGSGRQWVRSLRTGEYLSGTAARRILRDRIVEPTS